ncbi:MAG: hypothetical protein QXL94_07395 [Candidatus Parvarchaeum sp.]
MDSISKENECVTFMNIRVETFLLATAIFLSVLAISISTITTKPTYIMLLSLVVFLIISAAALGAFHVYIIKGY